LFWAFSLGWVRLAAMKSLYVPECASEINRRLSRLSPESAAVWGKMNAAQALAHCSAAIEVPLGDASPPRLMVGRLLGWAVKPMFSNEKEFGRNGPTDPTFVVARECDLDAERARLSGLIERFVAAGPESSGKYIHSFFGRITGEEWGIGMYKHLDHHLRQFGA